MTQKSNSGNPFHRGLVPLIMYLVHSCEKEGGRLLCTDVERSPGYVVNWRKTEQNKMQHSVYSLLYFIYKVFICICLVCTKKDSKDEQETSKDG